jgi:6-pyruvoyltetrahydropterin/6-carboxytetrahydropterin synthase
MHGHSYLLKVFLTETTEETVVPETGMVMDFKQLGFVKDFIDDVLDHKTVLDINDPLNSENTIWVLDDDEMVDKDLLIWLEEGYWIPDISKITESMAKWGGDIDSSKNKAIREKYEGLVFVDFVLTSENLAAWLFNIIQKKLESLPEVTLDAIELWETPKSHCRVES